MLEMDVTDNERRVILALRRMKRQNPDRPHTLIVNDVTGRGFYQLLEAIPVVQEAGDKRHIVNQSG